MEQSHGSNQQATLTTTDGARLAAYIAVIIITRTLHVPCV